MNLIMASPSSLYNEDRNLLRIREKERRNQEVHQEKKSFPVNAPLFGEPYKTSKGDELSSRIQNTLGNYEEVKELISTKNPNLFGIPEESSIPLTPQGKSRCLFYPEKTNNISQLSFFNSVHHQVINTPASGSSIYIPSHCPKATQSRMEPALSLHIKNDGMSGIQHQGKYYNGQERLHRSQNKKDEHQPEGTPCIELSDSALEMKGSLMSSALSSSVVPLASRHSNQPAGSRMLGSSKGSSKGCAQAKSPMHLALESKEEETLPHSLALVTSLGLPTSQPPPQTFPPPSLPSKTTAMQQKPTAYVRPMDGQDQAPSQSPELKPLPEDYHGHSYEKIPDFKGTAKAKLSKLKMPPESTEAFPNEVHCVEEILKEMTHSWPPPLTAIHTPNTAESSKFPFPTKEFQHIESVLQNHKQHATSSKTCSNSQPATSMLEDDLQISDSEDSGDEQASEKPPPCAPASVPQSLADSVVSAHSSNTESESTSDSDTSSDSESESSSSDSEENEPSEPPAAEPDPPTANKWQLDNWLTKVTQPPVSAENLNETGPQHQPQDIQGQGSSNTSGHEHSISNEPHPSNSSKAPRTTPEIPHPGKRNYPKSVTQQGPDGPPHWQTVGSKQPKKPIKASVQEDFQDNLRVESEPVPPHGSKDQSSKDKPKVKTKGRPRSSGDRQEKLKSVSVPCEKKKHKNSHPVPVKTPSDPEPTKNNMDDQKLDHFPDSPQIQNQAATHGSGSRSSGCKASLIVQEELVGSKVLLPFRDTKSLRDTSFLQSLVVKIDLAFLSHVPKTPGKGCQPKKMEHKQLPTGNKQESENRNTEKPNKLTTKRKGEAERDLDSKKIKLEKESKLCSSSSAHKDSSKTKLLKPSSDFLKKEPPPPPSASPSHKSAKNVHKRPRNESYPCVQGHSKSTSTTKDSHKDSSSKHKKVEGKPSGNSTTNKASPGDIFPVPSLPNGNSKPPKHQVKFEKQAADFYLKEAKKLKHKAESMSDKVGKAFKYLDAVLSFIECGIALETESPSSKAVYSMFSDTVDFIKFIVSLKSFPDSPTSTQEKIFTVLCMRCQSILYMAMFRCKKDTAIKYSRTLNEHFKSSLRAVQATSSGVSRNISTPSPLSPMPSPASSGAFQPGSSGISSTVSTPIVIQNMTSSYITITSNILNAYDLWEQADALARKTTEFFTELNASVCTLALNSSLVELVLYTRQALQQLRQVAKTL
ncbi:AF4/FMR2 family member 1 isoform X2 [Trichosurus vulpecula]|uniref:AF4/FMR2 family member 1 isoform X2 n=1 Tax=Trichosurus vulpecula TaxID=9337 RepID=UPI00186AEB05|nr:AF4/FMR2 family member 1 isoform X2 [Trichosurus vulpecula]